MKKIFSLLCITFCIINCSITCSANYKYIPLPEEKAEAIELTNYISKNKPELKQHIEANGCCVWIRGFIPTTSETQAYLSNMGFKKCNRGSYMWATHRYREFRKRYKIRAGTSTIERIRKTYGQYTPQSDKTKILH